MTADRDGSQEARIDVQVDRTLIPVGQPCERYAFLTIRAPQPDIAIAHPPLNLSLVIDRSGSMSGAKLEYVKEAATHALRLLNEMDRASVVIYDDEVEVLATSQAVTPRARDAMIGLVRRINSGAATNLSGGWFAGCQQVADFLNPDYLNRVLLLTDGLANEGLTDHEQLVLKAKAYRRQGITTTTFGVGVDFNQFLLQGIADGGAGHFYFIERPHQIPAYFQGELGEMLNVVAREMRLQVPLVAGMASELIGDLPCEIDAGHLSVNLGDACMGEERALVLKLSLPALAAGGELALPLAVYYVDPGSHRPVQASPNTLHFIAASPGACEEQPVNEAVLVELGRMLVERARMQALHHSHERQYREAQQTLRQAIDDIDRLLPPVLAQPLVDQLQMMLRRIADGMDAKTAKEMHYASYQYLRSRKDYGEPPGGGER